MAGNLTAMIASIFSGSAVTPDPYFEYTTLLLPGNGTNGAQNNTFLDASTNNFTITRNGNTTQGTFSPFSQTGWGNYFDGTGDYLSVPDNAAFTLGNSDFCIELWINSSPSMAGYAGFFGQWANATTNCSYVFRTQTSQIVQFGYTTNGNAQTGTTVDGSALTTNSWNHLVVCRSGANLAIFQNGTRTATHNISTLTISDSTRDMQIGYSTDGGYVLGYMSNLRLVKGSSVYDPTQTTITVPTAPLTAITNTSLLTCQSNRFIDNSTNNFTITRNGDTRVVAFSPFNPTASWSAATYGGSGYFDGNGDYLSVADNAALQWGTGDFCFETWVYLTAITGGFQDLIAKGTNNAGTFEISITSTGKIGFYTTVSVLSSSATLTTGQWTHVALTRSGTTLRLFVNGALDTTVSSFSTNFNNAGSLVIGAFGSGSGNNLNGFLSGYRCIKGDAVYTAAFTPPTSPPTAITNTSLLLNFTNAGIYDATSKNDLETVGNSQISTAQYKFPPSSMAFDGTGDYLFSPSSNLYNIATGDFTVEAWVYRSSSQVATYPRILTIGNANYNSFIFWTFGTTIYLTASTTGSSWVDMTFGTITNNVWTHLALVRNSGTITLYQNGTAHGTTYSYPTFVIPTPLLTVGALSFSPSDSSWTGYIQDLRITKGYARYTANFTAPTAAFPTL